MLKDFETAWRLEGSSDKSWDASQNGNQDGSQDKSQADHQLELQADNQGRVGICEAFDALVFVVADGAGNPPGGGAASRRAVEIVRKAITGERPNDDAQIWAERLGGIDRLLNRDKNAGETTAVVASIVVTGRAAQIVGASVGDSEAWLITANGNGVERLTQRQARAPLLGSSTALPVPFTSDWTEGTLLIATGGLFKYADHAQICITAASLELEQAAQNLLDLTRMSNGRLQADVGLLLCRRVRKHAAAGGKPGSLLQTVGKLLNWGRRG